MAQATRFGRDTLSVALLLIAVVLFIGLTTFVRSVAINCEDARWITGLNLLRQAYLQIVPELEPFFVTGHRPESDWRALAALCEGGLSLDLPLGVVVSLLSAALHVRYAARFRRTHSPATRSAG